MIFTFWFLRGIGRLDLMEEIKALVHRHPGKLTVGFLSVEFFNYLLSFGFGFSWFIFQNSWKQLKVETRATEQR